jgi:hypothetical protein
MVGGYYASVTLFNSVVSTTAICVCERDGREGVGVYLRLLEQTVVVSSLNLGRCKCHSVV